MDEMLIRHAEPSDYQPIVAVAEMEIFCNIRY